MAMQHGWVNIYKSGWFHREGKPGVTNRHGGDVYVSLFDALADIDPISHYIGTTPVSWLEDETLVANAKGSTPVPLSVSRARSRKETQNA